MDRHAVHGIIRAALRLTGAHTSGCKVNQNVILDAEMVAFRGENVDGKPAQVVFTTPLIFFRTEFWRIRQLIEDTAYGVRSGKRPLESVEEYALSNFDIVVDSLTR